MVSRGGRLTRRGGRQSCHKQCINCEYARHLKPPPGPRVGTPSVRLRVGGGGGEVWAHFLAADRG